MMCMRGVSVWVKQTQRAHLHLANTAGMYSNALSMHDPPSVLITVRQLPARTNPIPFLSPLSAALLFAAGVYHCTDPVPAEPDWGIALRVSKEAEVGGGGGGGEGSSGAVDATSGGKTKRRTGGEARAGSGQSAGAAGAAAAAAAVAAAPGQQEPEVSTPPLLVPLQSGDAYFLLDDFK